MAKKFLDGVGATGKDDFTVQDGSALTLTGIVRVLYDDTAEKREVLTTLDKIANRIREELAG